MKNIKAVVFDMDGLIFDTERLWVKSMLKAGKDLNRELSEEYLIKIAGLRHDLYDAQLQKDLGADFDVPRCRKIAQAYFNDGIANGEMGVKEGVHEILQFFSKKGFILAIASSTDIEDVKARLRVAGVNERYFTSIIGGDMVKKAKPDPEVYQKSCQVLGVEPSCTLALEDSDVGVEAAGKAGLKAIHIPDLKPSTEHTRRFAYKTCKSLLDVIELFKDC